MLWEVIDPILQVRRPRASRLNSKSARDSDRRDFLSLHQALAEDWLKPIHPVFQPIIRPLVTPAIKKSKTAFGSLLATKRRRLAELLQRYQALQRINSLTLRRHLEITDGGFVMRNIKPRSPQRKSNTSARRRYDV
jgi:hypothetical protein